MKAKAYVSFLCWLALVGTCWPREVTVYRYQVGAYKTQQEAEAKASEVRANDPEFAVTVEDKGKPFPWKVRVGWFGTYEEAKAGEAAYEADFGNAFVVSETMQQEQASGLGAAVPETLHEELAREPRHAEGMQEIELIYNASVALAQAGSPSDRTAWLDKMEIAVPYLIELTASYPESASDCWGLYWLGRYYEENYYVEHCLRRVSGARRASATEEASIEAALGKFEEVIKQHPEGPEAEEALYRLASMKNARTKGGVARENTCCRKRLDVQ